MYGLSIETYQKIKTILNKYPECVFKLFGSRARGDYKHNSDIDIAIINDISEETIQRIKIELTNLDIIYRIDLVILKNNSNKELEKNIINEGVDF